MVNSQELIERSVWSAINQVLIGLQMTVDPNNYLPITIENQKRCEEDIKRLKRYIPVFGTGSSQAKGSKVTPRIVINSRGFLPGSIGLPKILLEKKVGVGYTTTECPSSTLDQFIDIHLVANNQEDLRLLHQVLFWSIPSKGYIKPYLSDVFLSSGNIFIDQVNFFDNPDVDNGILEKVYQFQVTDSLILEYPEDTENENSNIIPFITDISAVLGKNNQSLVNIVGD